MQTEKRVNVDDLRDVLEFWEMKEEVEDFFKTLHNIDNPALFLRKESDSNKLAVVKYRAHYFINKIESIGKKEGGNGY